MAITGLRLAIITIAKPSLKHMIMLAAQRILNQVKPLIHFRQTVHRAQKSISHQLASEISSSELYATCDQISKARSCCKDGIALRQTSTRVMSISAAMKQGSS